MTRPGLAIWYLSVTSVLSTSLFLLASASLFAMSSLLPKTNALSRSLMPSSSTSLFRSMLICESLRFGLSPTLETKMIASADLRVSSVCSRWSWVGESNPGTSRSTAVFMSSPSSRDSILTLFTAYGNPPRGLWLSTRSSLKPVMNFLKSVLLSSSSPLKASFCLPR